MKAELRNKEISWLSFNARVLQEAGNPTVPLTERIKFLGIFSSNLDEFFRVRVATLNRLAKLGKKAVQIIGVDPRSVLKQIEKTVIKQQIEFEKIYHDILKELETHQIYIINEKQLTPSQGIFVKDFFREKVRPILIPIMIDQTEQAPVLKDHAIYLAVALRSESPASKPKYALIEVPTDLLPRFIILPREGKKQYIILLDDVIRYTLEDIFSMFEFTRYEAYTIKLTRDAELDLDDDVSESFVLKISKSLSRRKIGTPVRFVYDQAIPPEFLKYLIKRLKLDRSISSFIPGSRYHNFKDFMKFPVTGLQNLGYPTRKPLPHPDIPPHHRMLKIIQEKDILLNYPYQSFDYVLDFLREAAIDPKVTAIHITLYRVAEKSRVINALINAAKNGKKVKVVIELQARFDEEANIRWIHRLREEGVQVQHGIPGLKIHAKLILVTRKQKNKTLLFAHLGTGNFNEDTAKVYSDHGFFTSDKRITKEVQQVFKFIEKSYQRDIYRHLLVSPFDMRRKLNRLINDEIANARRGKPAYIFLKLNNLTDPRLIKKLYKASQAGVPIRLMVRGMFSLVAGVKGLSENIEARGVVDKYLEHSRILIFGAGGKEKIFLASADWMPRNLDKRVEVAWEITDPGIREELKNFMEIQWQDNTKARILNKSLNNRFVPVGDGPTVRSQDALYDYFLRKYQIPAPSAPKTLSILKTEGQAAS